MSQCPWRDGCSKMGSSLGRNELRAFTFMEVLTCLAIIAILAVLVLPVFLRVKSASLQTECAANLKQRWLAVALYREDYGGGAEVGNRYDLALPAGEGLLEITRQNPAVCRGPLQEPYLPPGYPFMVPHPEAPAAEEWLAYSHRQGGNSVLWVDLHHNDAESFEKLLFPKFGMATTLNGSLLRQRRIGPIHPFEWWEK